MPYIDLLLNLFKTPLKSYTPLMQVYDTPGKSLAPPPLINTLECFLKLCPIPGMWAIVCFLFIKLNLATGLLAELGFLGVTILVCKTIPFFWGLQFNTPKFFFLFKTFPC